MGSGSPLVDGRKSVGEKPAGTVDETTYPKRRQLDPLLRRSELRSLGENRQQQGTTDARRRSAGEIAEGTKSSSRIFFSDGASQMRAGERDGGDEGGSSVVAGLRKRLKDSMEGFADLRTRVAAEYREAVERMYYTVTGEKAGEATVEALVATGVDPVF